MSRMASWQLENPGVECSVGDDRPSTALRARGKRYFDLGERAGLGVGIALAHLLFLYGLLSSLHVDAWQENAREIEVHILSAPAERLALTAKLDPKTLNLLATPDLHLDSPKSSLAVAGVPAGQVLPPRPDPLHRNGAPLLPALAGAHASDVVLRVLVLPDGSVSDAQITRSSGEAGVDAAAMEFARMHWRFLPALIGTTAIRYWTTALMRFS